MWPVQVRLCLVNPPSPPGFVFQVRVMEAGTAELIGLLLIIHGLYRLGIVSCCSTLGPDQMQRLQLSGVHCYRNLRQDFQSMSSLDLP